MKLTLQIADLSAYLVDGYNVDQDGDVQDMLEDQGEARGW